MKNFYRISVFAFVALFCFAFNSAHAQVIRTVAGTGKAGYNGNGGLGDTSIISNPYGVAVDKAGNIFFVDNGNNMVREVIRATGKIATVAGNGSPGFSGDLGAATAASLSNPEGLALDTAGNIYVADEGNYRVREIVKSTGVINTVVGTGNSTFSGNTIASGTGLNPYAIVVDDSSNLYISDGANNRVYKVYKTTDMIYSIAGNGTATYYKDSGKADTSSLNNPSGIALDKHKNLYIADQANNRIRMVNFTTNVITTVCGIKGIAGYYGDGGNADTAQINSPYAVAVDTVNGNLYISDYANQRVRVVNGTTGIINTIAGAGYAGYYGDGMDANIAAFDNIIALTSDDSGNVYIADQGNQRIRKVTVTGPAITSQPTSPNFCDHSTAKLGITVSGTGTTYQWFVDSNYATKW
ncbi:MAG TPA: hypothetical protein VN922_06350, partial [Bacteroidia bacterium]|nr:hypothetical protein [Bacteroidia bacterium]